MGWFGSVVVMALDLQLDGSGAVEQQP